MSFLLYQVRITPLVPFRRIPVLAAGIIQYGMRQTIPYTVSLWYNLLKEAEVCLRKSILCIAQYAVTVKR